MSTQVKYFKDGKSKTLKSKHVITDKEKFSRAMDILPYPFDFKDDWGKRERFAILAGVLIGIGHTNGIRLRWGGDWDIDFNPENTKFYDGPHIELMD